MHGNEAIAECIPPAIGEYPALRVLMGLILPHFSIDNN